jgi:para-nitrobenzyl esterase
MTQRAGRGGWLLAVQVCCAVLIGCESDSGGSAPAVGTGGSGGAGGAAAQSGTLIQLANGSLQGKTVDSTREFLGIPYAKAPVGELRFAPPQPVDKWSGVRDATAFGPSCPQPGGTLATMGTQDEDCLSVNVYVPTAATATKALPVMVFIHGGAFVTGGSSQYEGESLSSAGPVVLVTLNYRLGALGFYSLPALDATRSDAPSGSDGIRDQQLALHWVQDNIAAFGGDPKNVTVFGESAGSMSVCLHLLVPGSSSLRQRVIMESGSCVGGGLAALSKDNANTTGQALADDLCSGESDQLACLRSQTTDALINWGADRGLFGPGWGPVVDGQGGVLPDTPENLLASQSKLAPFIIGTNKNEWGLFQVIGLSTMVTSVDELKTTIAAQFGAGASKVEAQYNAESDDEANQAYINLVTDMTFRCPTRTLVRNAADKASAVYVYSFEQGTAYHAQELDYVFGNATLSAFGGGPPSAALTSDVQSYWTQFATTGIPSAPAAAAWPKYDPSDEAYLTLVDPATASTSFAKNCDFWDDYLRNGGTVNQTGQ